MDKTLIEDWERDHYKPSELIIESALGMSGKTSKDELNDHDILMGVMAWLDVEVGSSRKREA